MNVPYRTCVPLALCAMLAAANARAQGASILGYWREPKGAIMRIAPCGTKVCVRIVTPAPGDGAKTDTHNPDPGLRARPICGLRIGYGFTETDPRHGEDGHLYDPRSGHTYSGSMRLSGGDLRLRGYIGFKLFGRTETWTRVPRPPKPCTPPAHAARAGRRNPRTVLNSAPAAPRERRAG